jgi:hypothetical protein
MMQQQLHTVVLLAVQMLNQPAHAGHSQQLCKRFMPQQQRPSPQSSFVSHKCTHASLTKKKALLRFKCKSAHSKSSKGAAVLESRLCSRTAVTTQHTSRINQTNVHATMLRCITARIACNLLSMLCAIRFDSRHALLLGPDILYHAHITAAATQAAE